MTATSDRRGWVKFGGNMNPTTAAETAERYSILPSEYELRPVPSRDLTEPEYRGLYPFQAKVNHEPWRDNKD